MNMAKRPVEKYDFKALGQAIKDARKERKESRKKVSDEMFISPQFLLDTPPEKNTQRRKRLQRFCFTYLRHFHFSPQHETRKFLKNLFETLAKLPYIA